MNADQLTPNLTDVRRFVDAICGDDDPQWTTIPESATAPTTIIPIWRKWRAEDRSRWGRRESVDLKPVPLMRTWTAPVDLAASELMARNQAGAGIFLTVNRSSKPERRKASDIDMVRALYVDLDGAPMTSELEDSADVVTQTSEGRWHAFWRVSVPLHDFADRQRALIRRFGSDSAIHA